MPVSANTKSIVLLHRNWNVVCQWAMSSNGLTITCTNAGKLVIYCCFGYPSPNKLSVIHLWMLLTEKPVYITLSTLDFRKRNTADLNSGCSKL